MRSRRKRGALEYQMEPALARRSPVSSALIGDNYVCEFTNMFVENQQPRLAMTMRLSSLRSPRCPTIGLRLSAQAIIPIETYSRYSL